MAVSYTHLALYETTVDVEEENPTLTIENVRDYAVVYACLLYTSFAMPAEVLFDYFLATLS